MAQYGNISVLWSSGPAQEVEHQAREQQEWEDEHQEEHQECPEQGQELRQTSQSASQEGLLSVLSFKHKYFRPLGREEDVNCEE